MAYETGTASSHIDLLNKVRAFLKTNSTLVGLSQQWTEQYQSGNQCSLQGPGLAGGEQINAHLFAYSDAGGDSYGIGVSMSTAFDSEQAFGYQPNQVAFQYMPLWNTSMPYWIIGNGQRCIVIAKVSTVYSAMYFGKLLPYGTPSQYPQPYYCAGVNSGQARWSSQSESHRNFWNPGESARILTPASAWRGVSNFYESSGKQIQSARNSTWPYAAHFSTDVARTLLDQLRENVDGTYTLLPIIVAGEVDPTPEIYGELDGAFYVSGFNNASENTITIGGATYLVVQDLYRTARFDYAAIKLA